MYLVCRLLLEPYLDHRALHSFPTRRSSDLTRLCSGRSAPTTAIQPEWLTSTVTALALSLVPPWSHSTRSLTREMIRLWLRNLSHLSCRALAAALETMLVDMVTSLWMCSRARRGDLNLVPRCVGVNSTFSKSLFCSPSSRSPNLPGPTNKKAGPSISRTGPVSV